MDKHVYNLQKEQEWIQKSKLGCSFSKQKLIEAHLTLIQQSAASYQGLGISYEDLVQEATIGFLKSIDYFDAQKSCHLNTYALFWIKRYLLDAIYTQASPIRIPTYWQKKAYQLMRFQNSYQLMHGELPSTEECCTALQLNKQDVEKIEIYNTKHCSLEELTVEISEKEPTLEESYRALMFDSLKKEWAKLSLREQNILTSRFESEDSPSRCSLSKQFHISPERIRQIEKAALKKLQLRTKAFA